MIIEETYVSFKTAKLLKEKGFNEKCLHYYDWDEENENLRIRHNRVSCNEARFPSYYSMPTQQMVMCWLREVHNIVIVIAPSMPWGKYNVSIYKKGNDYPIGFDGDSLIPSYEEACETSIKYCLENLI